MSSKFLDNLINLVKQDRFASIISLLILFFIAIITYKNNKPVQKVYNFITNFIPLIKKEYIILANFSKKSGNVREILSKYADLGCKVFKLDTYELFSKEGTISKENLRKIVKKDQEIIKKAKKRLKNKNSFIYVGFPHIPLGFLDGINFTDIDEPILYEHQGSNSECIGKGFFELNKIYNTNLDLVNTIDSLHSNETEIALKIEQSFKISDNDIKKAIDVNQIVLFGIKEPTHSSITNYAQIDLYQKKFDKLLSDLKTRGINKVHLFATTPVSLSFSLGRVIKHYHPEIIVYNYNNGVFDWGINLKTQEIIYLAVNN